MTDTASIPAANSVDAAELFSSQEIQQFGVDDVTAGGAIGKMLSALFLYTVFAMGIAGWWTYSSIIADKAADKAAAESQHSSQEHVDDHNHDHQPN
ncbi:MAG: hypothetical protein NTX48_12930 [Planctomycetales bacterium]|nr:hypothetical protein [Planctomycetales bacterium]